MCPPAAKLHVLHFAAHHQRCCLFVHIGTADLSSATNFAILNQRQPYLRDAVRDFSYGTPRGNSITPQAVSTLSKCRSICSLEAPPNSYRVKCYLSTVSVAPRHCCRHIRPRTTRRAGMVDVIARDDPYISVSTRHLSACGTFAQMLEIQSRRRILLNK
jgi:hypothetical protein